MNKSHCQRRFCPHGDELHDIEKLFIEYAWVFYTKAAAAPRDAAQRAPGGRRLGGLEPSGPKLLRVIFIEVVEFEK